MSFDPYNSRSPLIGCKSRSLFSDWEMMPRKTITQSTFEAELKDYSPLIISAIEQGMKDLINFCIQHPHASRKRNVRPTNLNAFIMQQLAFVNGLNSGEIKGNGRRSYVDIGSNRLFVKKIEHNLRPSNIPTKTVKMYQNQETVNEEDDLPITYLGYQVDEGWTHIIGIYAVHLEGNKIKWYTDIVSLANTSVHLTNDTSQEAEVTIKVALKRKQTE